MKDNVLQVLIVDDDRNCAVYLKKFCEKYSLECTVEADPVIALEKIKANQFFDILFVDYRFTHSKINGLHILEIVKQQYVYKSYMPYIPVLCISRGIKEILKNQQKVGLIFDFLEKPFKAAEVKALLEKATMFLRGKQGEGE
jgi:CheY-like chemotaxis protein